MPTSPDARLTKRAADTAPRSVPYWAVQKNSFHRLHRALLFLAFCVTGCTTVVHHPRLTSGGVVPAVTGSTTNTTAVQFAPKFEKWNPLWWFGNVDEPVPPATYQPDDPHRVRNYRWRNLGHNFTFYVIGIADREFTRTGRHPEHVFAPGRGWNWAVSRHHCCFLPFLSYHGGYCETYFGWRERGNFGVKLNFRRRHLASPAPPADRSGAPPP